MVVYTEEADYSLRLERKRISRRSTGRDGGREENKLDNRKQAVEKMEDEGCRRRIYI